MKHGIRTTEFWWGLTLSAGIFALVWTGRYPDHGTAGYEGVDWLIYIWAAYTGVRNYTKGKNETTTRITTSTGAGGVHDAGVQPAHPRE